MKILALDPSVMNRCGWATAKLEWADGDHTTPAMQRGKLVTEEWNWGSWEINGMNFKVRCVDLKDWIERDIGEFDMIVIEWPMFYSGHKGMIAAQEGYTINLAGIAMFIVGWFRVPARWVYLYTAPTWKGTVSKMITARRFFKLFNLVETEVDHDAIDACMMLVYHVRTIGLTT